jgi:hypothetical protein
MFDSITAEIRGIMQRAYFVTPDCAEVRRGLARVGEIRAELESRAAEGQRSIELVEAKSLATVAWLILSQADKILSQNC